MDRLLRLIRPETSQPLLHLVEHLVLDLRVARVVVRVMEGLQNLINDPVGRLVAAPRLDDEGDAVLDEKLSDLSGGLVEDETEVVLGEDTVRGVGGVGVVEDLVLVVVVDDGLATFIEDLRCLHQERLVHSCELFVKSLPAA